MPRMSKEQAAYLPLRGKKGQVGRLQKGLGLLSLLVEFATRWNQTFGSRLLLDYLCRLR